MSTNAIHYLASLYYLQVWGLQCLLPHLALEVPGEAGVSMP